MKNLVHFMFEVLLARSQQRLYKTFFAVWMILAIFGGHAFALPAVKGISGTPIDPTSADTFYGSSTTHTAGLCSLNSIMCGIARAVPIQEEARVLSQGGTLSYNQFALNVFEYVYKNIDTEFRYGLSKGGFGAILDQSATPFDQVHLMIEVLRQGIAAYPSSYGSYSASYQAGTVTLTGTQFQNWTGITGAVAACQFLANGGMPMAINGSTPGSCSSLSGSVSSVTISHIWVATNSKLYDPSYKAYAFTTGVDLASAMGCGTMSAPTCGSTSLAASLSGASTGFDASAQANYVQNVNYANLGTTLNGYAANLQHYIENNYLKVGLTPTVRDIVGGRKIDPTQMPTPGASLPYSSVVVQHTWTGDIPDQYRSRLNVQADNINVWLYADETYGYWIYIGGIYSTDFKTRYTTLFYEREKGTTAPNTPNLTVYENGVSGPTNEIVPLVNSTKTGITTDETPLTLTADHPYAANSGTYADDTLAKNIWLGVWNGSSKGNFMTPVVILQSWGKAGRGNFSRAARMGSDKDVIPWHSRGVSGTAIPGGSAFVLYNLMAPSNLEQWLSQAGMAITLGDAMAGTLTQEQHSFGTIWDDSVEQGDAASAVFDAVASLSVTNIGGSASATTAQFNMAVTAYDAFEGSAGEQANDSPDGGNPIRWFELTNEKSNRFYEATPTNLTNVLSAVTNYSTQYWGENPKSVVQNYLTATGPTFNMIVPKNGQVGSWTSGSTTLSYLFGPLLAYASDDSAIAYLSTAGTKAGDSTGTLPDPMSQASQSVQAAKPNKPIKFDVDIASGELTAVPNADIKTGVGELPNSLSYQRYYNSSQNKMPMCGLEGSPVLVNVCADPTDQRSMLGWTDNWQIDGSFSNDGYRALGYDAAVEASSAIATLFTLQDMSRTSSFQSRLASAFTAAWLEDQIGANTVVFNKPPRTEVYYHLPDGRYNPRPGEKSTLSQTGARVRTVAAGGWIYYYGGITFTQTDPSGAQMNFSYGREFNEGSVLYIANFFKPDTWVFPNGMNLSFSYTWTMAYNPAQYLFATLSSVTNSLGRSLTFAVDSSAGSDPDGYTTGYKVTDETGRSALFRNHGTAVLSVVSNPGYKVIFPDSTKSFLAFNQIDPKAGELSMRLSAVYLPNSATVPYVTLNWDGLRRASSVVDANSNATSYYPASLGSLELTSRGSEVDALGFATTNYYDQFSKLLQSTDPFGNLTTDAYDGFERLVQETLPEGNYDVYAYDARSNALSTVRHPIPGSPEAIAGITITTSKTYNEASNILVCANQITCNDASTSTSGNGQVTNYTWNATTGLLTEVQLPADPSGNRPETDYGYSVYSMGSANVSLLTSKTEYVTPTVTTVTQFAYNSSNKYILQSGIVDYGTGHLNLTTSFTFDSLGNVTQIDGPRTDVNDISNFTWDSKRRLIYSIEADPDGTGPNPRPATKYGYDGNDQIVEKDVGSTTSSVGSDFAAIDTWTFSHDLYGNVTEQTDTPNGASAFAVTQFSFDADERPNCTAVRMNPSVFGSLPSSACTLSTAGSYGQDQIGNLVYCALGTSNCAYGKVWEEQRGYGTSLVENYATHYYKPNGEQLSVTDALLGSHVTTYGYDGFDRLNLTTYPDGSTESIPSVTGYDGDSNVLSRTNRASETISFTYDNLDRMSTKAVPAVGSISANTIAWTYDLLNEVTGITDTLGNTLSYVYDLAKRETSASRVVPGITGTQTVGYQYDAANNRTRLTWPDSGYYVNYTYDALNHISSAVEQGATALASYGYDALARRSSLAYGPSQLSSLAYSWSPENDLVALTNSLATTSADVTFTNGFSPAHQFASSTISNSNYGFVPVCASTCSDTYTSVNTLNQYPGVTLGGSGESLSYDANGNLTADGTWTYTYDPENRLMTAVKSGTSVAYAYDPLGRRTTKTVNGSATYYLDDGDNEIAEYGPSGTLQVRYIPSDSIDDPIAMVVGSTRTYFGYDKVGSTVVMSNDSGNETEGAYTYDPFGNSSVATGEPFKFAGERLDAETGLYYYRARYYAPVMGRFLQVDPVGYTDDLNLYTYAGNDPTDKTDPMGKDSCTSSGGITMCRGVNYTVAFPQVPAFHDFQTNSPLSHTYATPVATPGSTLQQDRQFVTNEPTPGNPSPATPQGTPNDATPGLGGITPLDISPVMSFATKNQKDGQPVVVNVTMSGHLLGYPNGSGIVVREPTQTSGGTVIQNWGAGTGLLQSHDTPVGKILAPLINGVWQFETPPSAPSPTGCYGGSITNNVCNR